MRHASLVSLLFLAAWASFGRPWWAGPATWRCAFVGGLFGPRRVRDAGCCARSAGRGGKPDPYSVLGLEPGYADETEIRAAVRRLAKIYHPDVPETGDAERFQAVQEAAQQLLELGPSFVGQSSLERVYEWASSAKHSARYSSQQPPSSAARPLEQNDFAGSRGTRVDVKECASRRRSDLRKTAKLAMVTHTATPETLATVQRILTQQLGLPDGMASPNVPLQAIGFVLETNTIGMQNVADAVMALEDEFGVQLLTILVGTWVKFDIPGSVGTVQGLADFVESKVNA